MPDNCPASGCCWPRLLGIPYEGDVLTKILRDASLKADQVHPNAKGYRLMAERVADLLRKSGAL